MPIKQISLFVENRPGALSAVCRVLKENNIDIKTLSLADTQQFGILRLLVKECENAKAVLEKAGFLVKITDVLAMEVPDRPGGLSGILEIFDRHNLQVEYMYAFGGRSDRAVMVFRFDDPQKTIDELNAEPIEFVRSEELFK